MPLSTSFQDHGPLEPVHQLLEKHRGAATIYLETLASVFGSTAIQAGWSMKWPERGCYLHLEASELIEAVRGKGEREVTAEGADVLLVLLSLLSETASVDLNDVLRNCEHVVREIQAGRKGRPPGK